MNRLLISLTCLPKETLRLSLGRSLALEFELGADILKTAVAPTQKDIGLFAAVAVLRTALNFFLERELRQAQGRRPSPAGDGEALEPVPLSDARNRSSNAGATP